MAPTSSTCGASRRASSATANAFSARIYTPAERAKADSRANTVETYAKRFAAKEACSKALGTGFRRGVFWRDMGVVNLPSGRPTMKLTGGALKRLQAITPAGCEARIDVSLTDEGPTAQAIVIISAVPRTSRRKAGNLQSNQVLMRMSGVLDCAARWQPLQGRRGASP